MNFFSDDPSDRDLDILRGEVSLQRYIKRLYLYCGDLLLLLLCAWVCVLLSPTTLLPSGLVVQSVEERLIKSGGRWFGSRRGQRFFPLPPAVSHFLTRTI